MRAGSGFVENLLTEAIKEAHDGERQLFEERAHERSIVFHIARLLATHIEALSRPWSVDVDNDRWRISQIEGLKKQLHDLEGDEKDSDVYPDIIIHRRGGMSEAHNLLVIEVKKEEAKGHERDRRKLRLFASAPFHYQCAAFLVLPKDGGLPSCEWISR